MKKMHYRQVTLEYGRLKQPANEHQISAEFMSQYKLWVLSLLHAISSSIEKEGCWHWWCYLHSPTCSLQPNGTLAESRKTTSEAAIKIKHLSKWACTLSKVMCYRVCILIHGQHMCDSHPFPHNRHPPTLMTINPPKLLFISSQNSSAAIMIEDTSLFFFSFNENANWKVFLKL